MQYDYINTSPSDVFTHCSISCNSCSEEENKEHHLSLGGEYLTPKSENKSLQKETSGLHRIQTKKPFALNFVLNFCSISSPFGL